MKMKNKVVVIGGGLAGCECAYQLAKRGFEIDLFEMKPLKFSPAHKNKNLGEIVCSNSLKSESLTTASGLLKIELEMFDSLILNVAKECKVPAGNALAVDREKFSEIVDERIRSFENINVIHKEIEELPTGDFPIVVATGPLTSDKLSISIGDFLGDDGLFFFDASAPIVSAESIDREKTFIQDRYGDDGSGDYLNCPMNKEEYENFYNELIHAKGVKLQDFEKNIFEGCMPVEVLARRGKDSLRFGPLKPVGLFDPKSGKRPYAVVQLRRENLESDMYNLVGFQTNLTFSEQKKVFSLIPALKNAEFEKFGVMHKNTFICSPKHLSDKFELRKRKNVFFAGQISGVEGYVESTASGLLVALAIIARQNNIDYKFSCDTIIGALSSYISNPENAKNFQPMNANYGILSPLLDAGRDRQKKRELIYERSMREISKIKELFV